MKEVSSVLRRNLLALCGTIQHRNMERFVPATSIVLMLNYALQGQMMFADRSRYLGLFCNDMVNTLLLSCYKNLPKCNLTARNRGLDMAYLFSQTVIDTMARGKIIG